MAFTSTPILRRTEGKARYTKFLDTKTAQFSNETSIQFLLRFHRLEDPDPKVREQARQEIERLAKPHPEQVNDVLTAAYLLLDPPDGAAAARVLGALSEPPLNYPMFHVVMAKNALVRGNVEQAEARINQAILMSSSLLQAWMLRYSLSLTKNDVFSARSALEQALRVDPKNEQIRKSLTDLPLMPRASNEEIIDLVLATVD